VSEQEDQGHTGAPHIVALEPLRRRLHASSRPSPTRGATQGGGWPASRDGGMGERGGRAVGELGRGMDDGD
jgi:hypothetical protein